MCRCGCSYGVNFYLVFIFFQAAMKAGRCGLGTYLCLVLLLSHADYGRQIVFPSLTTLPLPLFWSRGASVRGLFNQIN